jgi:hypothetical protein
MSVAVFLKASNSACPPVKKDLSFAPGTFVKSPELGRDFRLACGAAALLFCRTVRGFEGFGTPELFGLVLTAGSAEFFCAGRDAFCVGRDVGCFFLIGSVIGGRTTTFGSL